MHYATRGAFGMGVNKHVCALRLRNDADGVHVFWDRYADGVHVISGWIDGDVWQRW